jgi:hypothetical protein
MLRIRQHRMFSLVPEGMPEEMAYRAGLPREYELVVGPGSGEFVSHVIASHLMRGQGHCAVFEESMREPSAPATSKVKVKYFVYGHDMYFFVDRKQDDIQETVRVPSSYPYVGALTRFDPSLGELPVRGAISDAQFEHLLSHITTVFIDAYDDIGFFLIEFV